MKLAQENINKALEALMPLGQVLVPTLVDEVSAFRLYAPQMSVDLDAQNTDLPPKQVLFPQTQQLYRFTSHPVASVDGINASHEQVLFGLRPCDARAIACLDQVFLGGEYPDSHYAARRAQLVIIAIACDQAAPSCFCRSMGVAPDEAPEADVLLLPTASGWNIHSQSAKGQRVLAALAPVTEAGEDALLPTAQPQLQVNMDGMAEKLPALFEQPLWQELSRPCLGCGVCTYLCPTCHCFELAPESRGSGGAQNRYWDSCLSPAYTQMAGGHNPRPSLKERLRNRYLHKLSYFSQRHGHSLCVGCGRCLAKCPAGLDICRVIELAGEVEEV